MDEIGIMLYGYHKEDALTIQSALAAGLGRKLYLLSASGKEDKPLIEALEAQEQENFEEKETPILLFLGFGDEEIQTALKVFPKDIRRAIFCGLTEENIRWKVNVLIEHLQEEDRYWKSKKG